MGLTKAARFSPQLLSQFPEVFSIAGNCSPKSALLPSSWPSLWCINSARQHTLLTLLSWSQILWGVKQVGPPAQASGRASLRCFATQKGQFKRRDYFPHSTLLKAVTNNFPDVDCFTHLSLSFFSSHLKNALVLERWWTWTPAQGVCRGSPEDFLNPSPIPQSSLAAGIWNSNTEVLVGIFF